LDSFSSASQYLQARGQELTLSDKFRVVDNLAGFHARLDISGGDPLVVPENWDLLEYASRKLGKSNVTVTATGLGVHARDVDPLARLIGEFNFTYDPALELQSEHDADRPAGYAEANLRLASRLKERGVFTRAELPLTSNNCQPKNLRRVYLRLKTAGIHRLLLMRLFPVGRGTLHAGAIPKRSDYLTAVRTLRGIEQVEGTPNVRLQCALRHLEHDGEALVENPCDLLAKSFGIMADGTLLLSPWAIGPNGHPLGAEWILGNLARDHLSDILAESRPQRLRSRLDANFGHCKIFAYLYSSEADVEDRMLDRADPLFKHDVGLADIEKLSDEE
jgi:MoaA/NifB/PqqE/SkfB family radical SAM enzyme